MKFTILCDTKPTNCTECPFWQEVPVPVANNVLDIQGKCILGTNSIADCPLNEVHTIFDTELPASKPDVPTVFCPVCQAQRRYNLSVKNVPTKVREMEFEYPKRIATCVHCNALLIVPELDETNDKTRNETYRILKEGK